MHLGEASHYRVFQGKDTEAGAMMQLHFHTLASHLYVFETQTDPNIIKLQSPPPDLWSA
jgi:hypothetical protein